MNKARKLEELKETLRAIKAREDDPNRTTDAEDNHRDADHALLKYIDSDEVTDLFEDIEKWYA